MNITMQWKLLERKREKYSRHQWRLANHLTDHVLHLFVNVSIILFHSLVFVFATRLKSRDIKRAWSSKVKGCKNKTDPMVNQKLNQVYLYKFIGLMITWKWLLKTNVKPWIWSIPPTIHNFTLKVLDFQKFQSHFWNKQHNFNDQ